MSRHLRLFATFIGSLLLAGTADGPVTAHAFDERTTHRLLTDLAARRSRLDQSLKDELGLPRGVDTTLTAMDGRSQSLLNWLLAGAENEDVPPCRASNHFHSPLRPYPQARVTDQSLIDGFCRNFEPIRSSVVWGTRFLSPTERGPATRNPFDWDTAQTSYLGALTQATSAARERALLQLIETLGHVAHLVQDLAVPAHTRNNFNSHLGFSTERIAEDGFEQFVRLNPSMVSAAVPTEVDIARRFVTRFWDTDRYTGTNPSSDIDQGLAEYTNANFVSLNTILTDGLAASDPYFHPYPRLSSTNADALFGKDASVARPVRAEDGRVDTGLYLDKIRDGETVTTFLRAGYLTGDLIDRAPPGTPKQLALQLDDEVYRSYAGKLVPMALGYSKALLDYFFRGRLDVDLFEADSDDPSIVRVRGTNASIDALLGGSLSLWADDPDGRRTPGTLLDATAAVSAEPNAPLESARFRLPAGAERVVAVYSGRLGEESPAPGVPGAVIGKVLGGVRVEEILINDVQRWVIRTPRQVVLLADAAGPLTYDRYEEVKWGDDDNLLVARTPFGVGQPNRVVVYRVPRARDLQTPDPARTDVLEIIAASTDDGQVVTVEQISSTLLSRSIALGTTVTIDHTIEYQQQLPRYTRTDVYLFQPFVTGGSFGQYLFDHTEFSPLDIQTVDSATQAYHNQFALAVDADHYLAFSLAGPSWAWSFADVTATTDGRVLALVRVDLTPPTFSHQDRVRRKVQGLVLTPVGDSGRFRVDLVDRQNCSSGFFCFYESVGIVREYPNATFWAVVDLSAGVTLAFTGAPSVTFSSSQRVEAPRWSVGAAGPDPLVYSVFANRRRGGGPSDTAEGDDEIHFLAALALRPLDSDPVEISGDLSLNVGAQRQASGALRADLESAVAGLGMLGTVPGSGSSGPADVLFSAGGARALLHVTTPAPPPRQRLVDLDSVSRVRPAAGSERLVLGANGGRAGMHATALIDWEPLGQRVRVPQVFEVPLGEFAGVNVGPATPAAVLVNDPIRSQGYVVPLDGAGAVRMIPDPGALFGFTLLNPRFLYGLDTLRFHRADATLAPTALPARLAPLPNNPFGDYHAIRVP